MIFYYQLYFYGKVSSESTATYNQMFQLKVVLIHCEVITLMILRPIHNHVTTAIYHLYRIEAVEIK